MTERQWNTIKMAFWMSLLAGLALWLASCTPTEPTPEKHPNEIRIEQFVECYRQYANRDEIVVARMVTVTYSDEVRWVRCNPGTFGDGPNGECVAAGWAFPIQSINGHPHIEFYGPFVRNECPLCALETTEVHLNEAAAHEMGHVVGNWGENAATAWMHDALTNAGCL